MPELTDKSGDQDEQLVVLVKRGDHRAFSAMFTKYYSYLYNYGLQIATNRETLVKDALQELFLSLWLKRENLSEVGSLRAYLFKAIRLKIYRLIEKQQARHKRDRSYFEASFQHILNIEELIINLEISKERREQLKFAIESLSKRKREVIYLKFYEGLTNEEISAVMGINVQSVYNHASAAIKILNEYIKETQRFEPNKSQEF